MYDPGDLHVCKIKSTFARDEENAYIVSTYVSIFPRIWRFFTVCNNGNVGKTLSTLSRTVRFPTSVRWLN